MYVMCAFGCRVGFEAALNELLSKFFIKQFRTNPLPYLQEIEKKIENQIVPEEIAFILTSFCFHHHLGNKCTNYVKLVMMSICGKPIIEKCEQILILNKLYGKKNMVVVNINLIITKEEEVEEEEEEMDINIIQIIINAIINLNHYYQMGY